MLHWPSAAAGAGISAAAIIVSILVIGGISGPADNTLTQIELSRAEPTRAFLLDGDPPSLGDEGADVVLVEFGDYQCVACSRFFDHTEDALVRDYVETGKVRLVFRDFTIIGQDSANAAHGSHCAREQGMFWEYHDTLYANWNGENTGWASPENLVRFAAEVGLDGEAWSSCMNEARYEDTIVRSNGVARALELPGTPSFFVIGPQDHITVIPGPQPYDVFSTVIEQELAR